MQLSLTYAYNANDLITALTNGTDASNSHKYEYDELARLSKDTLGGSIEGSVDTFDAVGNRLSRGSSAQGVPPTAQYTISASSNRVMGQTGNAVRNFSYTPQGHLLSSTGWLGGRRQTSQGARQDGLRIVAKRQDDGNHVVSIRSAGFGEAGDEQGESVTADKMPPPRYPEEAYQSGITGAVYLVIRVGRQGVVEDIVAEQINLTAIGSEQQMKRGRDLLSRAALQKAKSWTFKPPTKGRTADAPFWSVRVPVDFQYTDYKEAKYGQWEAYVPGPRQQPSWIRDHDASGSPDAMVAGGIYEVGKGPRLLTPLGQG